MINKKRFAFTLAILASIGKFLWTVLIALFPGFMQSLLNWFSQIYSVQPIVKITPVIWTYAIIGVIFAFIVAYIMGFIFAALFNWLAKNHK